MHRLRDGRVAWTPAARGWSTSSSPRAAASPATAGFAAQAKHEAAQRANQAVPVAESLRRRACQLALSLGSTERINTRPSNSSASGGSTRRWLPSAPPGPSKSVHAGPWPKSRRAPDQLAPHPGRRFGLGAADRHAAQQRNRSLICEARETVNGAQRPSGSSFAILVQTKEPPVTRRHLSQRFSCEWFDHVARYRA